MDAAMLQEATRFRPGLTMTGLDSSRLIPAAEFRRLLVSHRRMVRVDRRDQRLRGLQDLDTGEVFLTDERRLLEAIR
jgi:hypothetical protein